MGDEIDKVLGDFVGKGMAAEIAAGEAIGAALTKEADALNQRARDGDEEAAKEIARTFLGRDQASYVQMVIETSGIRLPALDALVAQAARMGEFDTFKRTTGTIFWWAEGLVVHGRFVEPPRADLFNHDAKLWSDHVERHPDESYPIPRVPERLKGQQHTMKWLTWLGFDVHASKHPHPGVTAETLYIDVDAAQLTQEAKRLQVALGARGVRGVQVEATYFPHTGLADESSVRVMVHDEDFRPHEVADD